MTDIRFASLGAAAAIALTLGLAATPAYAINDDGRGSTMGSIMTLFGIGDKDPDADIQYRERSPLVVPPKADLPTPQPSAAGRTAAWPTDQETVRARKRAAAAVQGRVRQSQGDDAGNVPTRDLGQMGRLTKEQAATQLAAQRHQDDCNMDSDTLRQCNPATFWNKLSIKSLGAPQKEAGADEREWLTEPPKGFMKPTKKVKATFEVKHDDDQEAPGDYFRRQAQGKE